MKPKKSAKDLVDAAMVQVHTLPVAEAIALHGRADTVFVDLRDVRELEREGIVPGAVHAPRGLLEFWVDPASPYFHKAFEGLGEDKAAVLFCAAGWRSALAAQALQDMGFDRISHIEGGYTAWKEAGAPVADKPRRKEG